MQLYDVIKEPTIDFWFHTGHEQRLLESKSCACVTQPAIHIRLPLWTFYTTHPHPLQQSNPQSPVDVKFSVHNNDTFLELPSKGALQHFPIDFSCLGECCKAVSL